MTTYKIVEGKMRLLPAKKQLQRQILSVSAIALTASSPVWAQDAPTADNDLAVEEIVVTGSRIRRQNLLAPSPVTTISAADLERQGVVNIADVLNQLPSLGSSFSTAASTGFIGTTGLSFLDLRRLGTERTLVLVNGRRHVGSSAGDASVDINSIPQELTERVEVITGGASSVYGADAVSGVVNFIMKDDYEGLSLYAQAGQADEGDAFSYTVRGIMGGNFASNKGNAVVTFEWSETNGYNESDRSFARRNRAFLANPDDTDIGVSADDGIPDSILFEDVGLNFITEFGLVQFLTDADGDFIGVAPVPFFFAPDGSVRAFDAGGITDGGNSVGGDTLRFSDPALEGALNADIQRIIATGRVSYNVADTIKTYAEMKYVNAQSFSEGTPAFTTGGGLFISRENPFIPDAAQAFLDDASVQLGTPVGGFFLARIGTDLGKRGDDVERELFRGVLGLEGSITDNLDYDLSYTYGRSTNAVQQTNNRINDRFFAAADVVADPVTGDPVCRVTIDPDTAADFPDFAVDGCVPINLFGNKVSEEGKAFVNANGFLNESLEQNVISGIFNGNTSGFVELPGGPIGFAGGAEYREEKAKSFPTEIDQLGLTFLNLIPPTIGQFDVWEIFGEVSLPLLNDLPFAQELTLEGAVRYGDYSTVGGTTAWSVRGLWRPINDLMIRASYSEAVRAPNISELFGPQSQTFLGFEDPCDVDNIDDSPDPALRAANCAALGIPADFTEDETRGTQPGTIGGNPDVGEERAETLSIGAVFTPTYVPGLSLTVDFWDIDIKDAISSPGLQDVLDNCVDAPSIDNTFCGLIERDAATRQVIGFTLTQQNIAALDARGIDIEASYEFDVADLGIGDYGRIRLNTIGTHLMRRRDFEFQNEPDIFDVEDGELGDPNWVFNTNLTYFLDRFTFNYEVRFLSDQLLVEKDVLAANPDVQFPNSTGRTFFHDIQISYQLTDEVELRGGINNLTQKFPPFGLTGAGTGSAIFDTVGRFYYAGARVSF